MTEHRAVSEKTDGHDHSPESPPPAAPRGVDGESRVVAERSGADTSFPERPLLADPDDARSSAGTDSTGTDSAAAGEESGKRTPEPEVGPAS